VGYYSKYNQASYQDFNDQMSPVYDPTALGGHLTEVLQAKVEAVIQSHATDFPDNPLFMFYAMQNGDRS
jgi:hypothetical protein